MANAQQNNRDPWTLRGAICDWFTSFLPSNRPTEIYIQNQNLLLQAPEQIIRFLNRKIDLLQNDKNVLNFRNVSLVDTDRRRRETNEALERRVRGGASHSDAQRREIERLARELREAEEGTEEQGDESEETQRKKTEELHRHIQSGAEKAIEINRLNTELSNAAERCDNEKRELQEMINQQGGNENAPPDALTDKQISEAFHALRLRIRKLVVNIYKVSADRPPADLAEGAESCQVLFFSRWATGYSTEELQQRACALIYMLIKSRIFDHRRFGFDDMEQVTGHAGRNTAERGLAVFEEALGHLDPQPEDTRRDIRNWRVQTIKLARKLPPGNLILSNLKATIWNFFLPISARAEADYAVLKVKIFEVCAAALQFHLQIRGHPDVYTYEEIFNPGEGIPETELEILWLERPLEQPVINPEKGYQIAFYVWPALTKYPWSAPGVREMVSTGKVVALKPSEDLEPGGNPPNAGFGAPPNDTPPESQSLQQPVAQPTGGGQAQASDGADEETL